jgi:uncharacterized protein YbaR (Trm112 family)
MPLDPELMAILACPACKTEVFEHEDAIYCVNGKCRRVYAITDGFPVMLVEESRELSPVEWNEAMKKRPE